MRIAISGTHRSGKSTLIDELSSVLPDHVRVDEPYLRMEEDGHEFSHPPSLEDFEAQLEHSIEALCEVRKHALFDRCPLDFLAYAAVHEDADAFDLDGWLPEVRAALETLDLIVFVPIEAKDRIVFSPDADEEDSRGRVDEKLRELLLDDPFELDVEVLEVAGSAQSRARAVLERIRRGSGASI